MTTTLTAEDALSNFFAKAGIKKDTIPSGVSVVFREAGLFPYIDVHTPSGTKTIEGRVTGVRTPEVVFAEVRNALTPYGVQTFDTRQPTRPGLIERAGQPGFLKR
jgi:hypothetical protein